MAGHGSKSGLPSSSANGSAEWPPDDRLRRMIQYSVPKMFFREYWMPRRSLSSGSPEGETRWRGMTPGLKSARL